MNDLPRQKLRELITKHGHALCDDPRLCEALLRDFCGQYRREIFILVSALKDGVANELLKSQNSVPQGLVIARLSKRLQDDLGMTEESALWTVNSWDLALGVIAQPQEKLHYQSQQQQTGEQQTSEKQQPGKQEQPQERDSSKGQ